MGDGNDDAQFRSALDALVPADWAELRALVEQIDEHGAPFQRQANSAAGTAGIVDQGYPIEAPIIGDTVDFLYKRDLVVPFDWPGWEGKQHVERGDVAALAGASAEDCLRYLTVIVRGDRFSSGTLLWSFEEHMTQTLLHRLLDSTGNAE
ncbi:DUF6508 domain-containing protein [Rhodococcus sp. NPDC060090]|uniref:DUF6508 domain-containing protein n=1 Tax=Rhodococcus sp. NPDC060090 TaxID=3347056 RepID=UPI003660D482